MAMRTLPMRVRIGGRGSAKRIALGKPPILGIPALLLLYLRKQQALAALVQTFALHDLDLMPSLAGQAGIEGDARQ